VNFGLGQNRQAGYDAVMNKIKTIACLLIVLMAANAKAQAPFVDPASEAGVFGDPKNILFWTPEQQVAG